ncbi:MAG: histone deacetylase [Candidatus Thorarchaeota archaeon]
MTTDFVFHEAFTKHELSPGHPESPDRLRTAMDFIKKRGLLEESDVTLVTPKEAELEEIYPLHGKGYLEDLRDKSEQGGGIFTLDTSSNRYTYEASLLAAGGGIMAVDRILDGVSENAYVLCRPPGHHAEYSRAFGFCFINNIAVAAQHLVDKRGLERVLVVDYDAHHGNGTQNAFYSNNQVLYIGLHQDGRTLFPGSGFPSELGDGEGRGYNVNLAMYPNAGNRSYRHAFEEIVEPIAASFNPDFVLVSVGFDCHYTDPLTSLGLSTSGLAMMNEKLHNIAKQVANGNIVFFLEGGYNLEINGRGSQILMEELSGAEVTQYDDSYSESDKSIEYTESLVDLLREYLEPIFWT